MTYGEEAGNQRGEPVVDSVATACRPKDAIRASRAPRGVFPMRSANHTPPLQPVLGPRSLPRPPKGSACSRPARPTKGGWGQKSGSNRLEGLASDQRSRGFS